VWIPALHPFGLRESVPDGTSGAPEAVLTRSEIILDGAARKSKRIDTRDRRVKPSCEIAVSIILTVGDIKKLRPPERPDKTGIDNLRSDTGT
jgi:hypothetical protein